MKSTIILLALAALLIAGAFTPAAAQALPNPVLYFLGQEYYVSGGSNFVRYRYAVFNSSDFPDSMFAAAPTLAPCGSNTNASRTWVDLYDQRGKRLYGFCALKTSNGLNTIWFALPEGTVPPSWIYVELNDRQTATKYKSNLAETTL